MKIKMGKGVEACIEVGKQREAISEKLSTAGAGEDLINAFYDILGEEVGTTQRSHDAGNRNTRLIHRAFAEVYNQKAMDTHGEEGESLEDTLKKLTEKQVAALKNGIEVIIAYNEDGDGHIKLLMDGDIVASTYSG